MAENNIFFPDSGIESLPGVSTTKSLHMIFVVDNSGSMRHKDSSGMDRMTAVNTAFDRMLQSLQDLQAGVQDAYTIYISIMFFNEDPEWHVQVAPIATYFHQEIPVSPYVTYYSRAYQELNSKLSRSAFMNQKGKMAAPYIMMMTDGAPTEGDNYEAALDELKKNGWFDVAQRYAVLIGKNHVVMQALPAWLLLADETNKTVVYERGNLIFVFNWGPHSIPNYEIPVRQTGDYQIILTTDEKAFGCFGNIDVNTKFPSEKKDDSITMKVYNVSRVATVYQKL